MGALHEFGDRRVYFTHEESGVRITVHAVEIGGDVDIADVTLGEHGGIGDAVADHFIEGTAQALGKASVAKCGGVCAEITEVLMSDAIQLIRGDSRLDVFTHELQGVCSNSAGLAHGVDGFCCLDVTTTEGRWCWFTYIFRAHDVWRNAALGGDHTWFEHWHLRSVGVARVGRDVAHEALPCEIGVT